MSRQLQIAILFMMATTLAACEKKVWSEDEIADIAGDAAGDAIADSEKVADLESRVSELERKLGAQQAAISANEALASSVSQQVAFNAKVANDNVLAEATKRGECGRTTEYGPGQPPAWIRYVPVPCTEKNYFKK